MQSWVWRLLRSAFSNAAKFFISPLRDVLGEHVVTCDRGPNVVPAPTVIKSASDGTSSALDSSHFHFQGYKVQSRGLPGNAGVGTLLRPLPSPGREAWHFHACSVFLSICEVGPGGLHMRSVSTSAVQSRARQLGGWRDEEPGTGRLSWFQGAGSGGCAPFSCVHLSQQKAPRVVVPGPSPLLHKVARFQVSQVR